MLSLAFPQKARRNLYKYSKAENVHVEFVRCLA